MLIEHCNTGALPWLVLSLGHILSCIRTENSLTIIFNVGQMWGCATGPLSGTRLSLVIKAHIPLLRMLLAVQGSLPVNIPASLCCRAGLCFHLFKL